jgi:hypothetical protein
MSPKFDRSRAPIIASLLLAWSTIAACSSDAESLADDGSGGGDVSSATVGSTTSGVGGGGGMTGPVINQGFIGGPCEDDADCDYDGGFCLRESDGFPSGMCSLDCDKYCPDQDGAVTTFCIDPAGIDASIMQPVADGLCTTRCDYGESQTGCRGGYQCQLQSRYGDTDTKVYSCVPGGDAPFELGECHKQLLSEGIAFSPALNPKSSPESHPNLVCDIQDPIYITPYLHGVTFRPGSVSGDPKAIFTACDHGLSMVDSAELLAGQGVSDLIHWGVYNCRVISGSNKLSEHGYANAIDIAGLKLQDGGYHSVLGDWEKNQASPASVGGKLLRGFAQNMFDDGVYNIILSPDYNDAHADHLHCDLTPGAHLFK